jgi:hypothetical protein
VDTSEGLMRSRFSNKPLQMLYYMEPHEEVYPNSSEYFLLSTYKFVLLLFFKCPRLWRFRVTRVADKPQVLMS